MILEFTDSVSMASIMRIENAVAVPRRSSKMYLNGKRYKIVDEKWNYHVDMKRNPLIVIYVKEADEGPGDGR